MPPPALVIPPAVMAWLESLSADGDVHDIEPTFGGFSNLTFFATVRVPAPTLGAGARDAAEAADAVRVVVKAASSADKRADVRREARVLPLLTDTGLPVPAIRAHAELEDWTVSVIDVVDGEPGLSLVQTRETGDLAAHGALLGRLLRQVHLATPTPVTDPTLDLAVRADELAEALGRAGLPDAVRSELLDALAHPMIRRGVALVHGDFGFHNTLWQTTTDGKVRLSGLVDWEWAGWGNPLVDLSWLWWTLRFRLAPAVALESAIDGYTRQAVVALGWQPDAVLALVRAQMAQIVVRTPVGSPPREEWLRRIAGLSALGVPPL
jgi:aminoglycoside phosphotransferase (APT) family kinase protein